MYTLLQLRTRNAPSGTNLCTSLRSCDILPYTTPARVQRPLFAFLRLVGRNVCDLRAGDMELRCVLHGTTSTRVAKGCDFRAGAAEASSSLAPLPPLHTYVTRAPATLAFPATCSNFSFSEGQALCKLTVHRHVQQKHALQKSAVQTPPSKNVSGVCDGVCNGVCNECPPRRSYIPPQTINATIGTYI